MDEDQVNYATIEKALVLVVFALESFVLNKFQDDHLHRPWHIEAL